MRSRWSPSSSTRIIVRQRYQLLIRRFYAFHQCCGSGSVGSVRFWASRIRIRIRQSQVRIRILPSSIINSKKVLDFYCFVTSFWLFTSVPDPVADPYVFGPPGSASGSASQWYGSEDSDPYQNVTDPQHCFSQKRKILNWKNCVSEENLFAVVASVCFRNGLHKFYRPMY